MSAIGLTSISYLLFCLLESYKTTGPKETEDYRGQISPAYTRAHTHTHYHTLVLHPTGWVIATGRHLPSVPHCSLMPQWLLVILITLLFYNFKIPAALFSNNHVWSNTFLHYNILFCFLFFFFSLPTITKHRMCVFVCLNCWHTTHISRSTTKDTLAPHSTHKCTTAFHLRSFFNS